jgi:beta-lactamase regulating signal transducer with metallopeptidase domain
LNRLLDFVTANAEGWAVLMGHAAWQGALVGLAALVIVAVGRRCSSPVRYWILVLALIKFATPPMTAMPTGLFSLVSVGGVSIAHDNGPVAVPAPQPIEAPVPLHSGGDEFPGAPDVSSESSLLRDNRMRGEAASHPATTADAPARVRSALSVPAILMLVHLSGAALVMVLFAVRSIGLQIASWRMGSPNPELAGLMSEIARRLRLRFIPILRLSRDSEVPYSAGVLRPIVVLPAGLPGQLSRDELQAVLCHELAHHRRGDLWLNLMQVAIAAVWWFHPVVWLLNRAIRSIREECCDDMLLARQFVTDEAYCTTLVRVAQKANRRFCAAPAVVSIADGPHPLAARIRRIMDERLPRRERPGALPIVVLCVLAAAVLPGVRAAPAKRPLSTVQAAGKIEPAPALDLDYDTGPPVGGRIVDEQNRPLAGARVVLTIARQHWKQERLRLAQTEFEATTAADGTWSIASLPADASLSSMRVSHPEYAGLQRFALDAGAMRELGEANYERILRKGVVVFGRVTDVNGTPVDEATVALGQYFNNFDAPSIATTGTNGEYRFENCREGDSLLTVYKVGLAPHMRTVEVGKLDGQINVQLLPGRTLHVRVLDKSGEPIEGASVTPFQWPNTVNLTQLHNFGKTDANGIWMWNWVPEQGLPFMVSQFGYMRRLSSASLRPTTKPHEIVLLPELRVRVKVVDDATGQPVPAVRLTLGIGRDPKSQPDRWLPAQEMASAGGQFAMRQTEFPWEVCAVRIEANGFVPMESRIISADEENVAIDFRLKAARGHEAIAFEADGERANGAVILVGSKTALVNLNDMRIDSRGRRPVIRTDQDRRFHLDEQAGDFTLFVVGTSGSASIRRAEFDATGENPVRIQLKPWARVEGSLQSRKKFLPDEPITLAVSQDSAPFGMNATSMLETRTDVNGRFVFDRVPLEGEVVITHVVPVRTERGPFLGSGASARFKSAPGQIRSIALGGAARTVIGRFQLNDEAWAVDWETSIGSLQPTGDRANTGIVYLPAPRFGIQKDGAFQIDGVPPGPYTIAFELLALRTESSLRLGNNGVRDERKGISGLIAGEIVVTDTAAGDADQPFEIGTLTVGAVPATSK